MQQLIRLKVSSLPVKTQSHALVNLLKSAERGRPFRVVAYAELWVDSLVFKAVKPYSSVSGTDWADNTDAVTHWLEKNNAVPSIRVRSIKLSCYLIILRLLSDTYVKRLHMHMWDTQAHIYEIPTHTRVKHSHMHMWNTYIHLHSFICTCASVYEHFICMCVSTQWYVCLGRCFTCVYASKIEGFTRCWCWCLGKWMKSAFSLCRISGCFTDTSGQRFAYSIVVSGKPEKADSCTDGRRLISVKTVA